MTDKNEVANKLAKLFFASDTGYGGNASTPEAAQIKAELAAETKDLVAVAVAENLASNLRQKIRLFCKKYATREIYNQYIATCAPYKEI